MTERRLPDRIARRAIFMVWGPPSHGPRSKVFARTLGIPIEFIFSTERRGGWVAVGKYGYQAVATMWLMIRRRPRLVFIQTPPSFAVFFAWIAGLPWRSEFVIDAHSAAMLSPWWTKPAFLYRFLARKAVTTIVTNEHFAEEVESWGGHATVVRDIPTAFTVGEPPPMDDGFSVMVVNTFADDEPLEAVVKAVALLEDVTFYITGNVDRAGMRLPEVIPPNARFTGFLPDDAYFALMQACGAVLCLTTRDHTMQRGACEALSMARPIITSDWQLLRDYFRAGTVHVAADPEAIANGVREIAEDHARYEREIRTLQEEQQAEWDSAMAGLVERLGVGHPNGRRKVTS